MATSNQKKTLAGVVGSAALAASIVAFVGGWEGKANDPYQDLIGKWTVCYGETNVVMKRYTDAQCKEMLDASLAEYAAPVLKRTPQLAGHDNQLIAVTSFAYNLGTGAYAGSTAAARFGAGDYRGGCEALASWNRASFKVKPIGKSYSQCIRKANGDWSCVVSGIDNRRRAERAICLQGL